MLYTHPTPSMLRGFIFALCITQLTANFLSGFVSSSFGVSSRATPARDISTKNGEMVSRTFEIDATVDECFEVAVGFEQHHLNFIHTLRNVKVLEKHPNGMGRVVEFTAGLPQFPVSMTFVNEYEIDYPRGLKFHARSGFKTFNGSYKFERVGSGKTQVQHELFVDPTPSFVSVPTWLLKPITSAIMADSIRNFKDYVEEYSKEHRKANNSENRAARFFDNTVLARVAVA